MMHERSCFFFLSVQWYHPQQLKTISNSSVNQVHNAYSSRSYSLSMLLCHAHGMLGMKYKFVFVKVCIMMKYRIR